MKWFQHFHDAMTILGYATFFGTIAWGLIRHHQRTKALHEEREMRQDLPLEQGYGAEASIRPLE